ncbi:hypothetical protein AWW68_13050 [Roseivirga spongicola]|uniref:SMEK domain-containing protein n=1 Tax=Roseivirga spongicola TaxID=333140 RepID=A0A150X4Q8_9BACT|nr:SMEK domain-containing protein [Roseivirga spongicola]KYG73612.1 hypothetical protein AWW68_13050 [Roseivirga spongicola]
MKRIRLTNSILESLTRFSTEIQISNKNAFFDINIQSEYLLIPLLNLVFDYKLVNANQIKKNYPAVDLIDLDNRLAFQITSTYSSHKVKKTLESFRKNDLHKLFDEVFFLFLTTNDVKVNSQKVLSEVGTKIVLEDDRHFLNFNSLFSHIQSLSLNKIERIEALLTEEFHEEKVKARIQDTKSPDLRTEPYFLNLVSLDLPKSLFVVDLNIEKEKLKKDLIERKKEKGQKMRKFNDRDLFKEAINQNNPDKYCEDWVIHGQQLISFRDFTKDVSLAGLVDQGTSTELSIEEFCFDEDKKRVFKNLLNAVLREYLKTVKFEWYHPDKIFRIKSPNADMPKEVKVTWKLNKKPQPRSVISEIWNKNKTHIICFRHLAFSSSIFEFDGRWFFSINPTYSFTTNGYRKSRFSQYYMTGKKQNDDNKSIYHDLRFILWNIKKLDSPSEMFQATLPYDFKIGDFEEFKSGFAIKDDEWNPKQEKVNEGVIDNPLFN